MDTHILKFLRQEKEKIEKICDKEININVPKSTPSSNKKYKEIKNIFIYRAEKSGKPITNLDLEI